MLSETDSSIIRAIENKIEIDSSFWDFKDNYKKEHIHGIIDYPATMVPKMQAELMDIIRSNTDVNSIVDPFMGSGTILVEGMLRGYNISGSDINPLAYLITKVKTTLVPIDLLNIKIKELINRLESNLSYEIAFFPGIDKWFRKDIIEELSKIKQAIKEEPDIVIRRIFWVSFCQILRETCNSRKSTFKLHIKEEIDINEFEYKCILSFKKHLDYVVDRVAEFQNKICSNCKISKTRIKYQSKIHIYYRDSIKLMGDRRSFKDDSVDMISTSPPYGDNHTTVTYGQFSVLQLRWIDLNDIYDNIDESIINTLNKIDKDSLGGVNYLCDYISSNGILTRSDTLNSVYIKLICDNEIEKARKVASFYIDFERTLSSCFRILKPNKYAIFTVGNRRVNNQIIEFNNIMKELSNNLNASLIYDFRRNILNKRMPNKVSKLKNNKSVESIKEENIVIFRKNE